MSCIRRLGGNEERADTFNQCSPQYATERNSDRRVMGTARVVAPYKATATLMGGFSEPRLRRERANSYPASSASTHSLYIRCACLLNSLLSEEIRSARYWPRWGYVDRAAVRYWGRGVRVPLVVPFHYSPLYSFSLYVCACVCVCTSCPNDFLRQPPPPPPSPSFQLILEPRIHTSRKIIIYRKNNLMFAF